MQSLPLADPYVASARNTRAKSERRTHRLLLARTPTAYWRSVLRKWKITGHLYNPMSASTSGDVSNLNLAGLPAENDRHSDTHLLKEGETPLSSLPPAPKRRAGMPGCPFRRLGRES